MRNFNTKENKQESEIKSLSEQRVCVSACLRVCVLAGVYIASTLKALTPSAASSKLSFAGGGASLSIYQKLPAATGTDSRQRGHGDLRRTGRCILLFTQ